MSKVFGVGRAVPVPEGCPSGLPPKNGAHDAKKFGQILKPGNRSCATPCCFYPLKGLKFAYVLCYDGCTPKKSAHSFAKKFVQV